MTRRPRWGRTYLLLLLAALTALGGWAAWRFRGSSVLPALVGRRQGRAQAPPIPAGMSRWEVELFFSSPEGNALVTERREIPDIGDTLKRCRALLEELKRGPAGQLAPLLPVDAEIRSLFQVDDILVMDLEPKIRETAVGALQEALFWYSMVNTLIMNIKEIKGVHFLVDGQETESILGHLDMRGAFTERLELVRWN